MAQPNADLGISQLLSPDIHVPKILSDFRSIGCLPVIFGIKDPDRGVEDAMFVPETGAFLESHKPPSVTLYGRLLVRAAENDEYSLRASLTLTEVPPYLRVWRGMTRRNGGGPEGVLYYHEDVPPAEA